ncbi:MAG: metalloregulator ArsR/SmtB family transcription factor [Myxococcota bacterium]|nr:metalloregulator ArsR/SmtB family transcription factor [Myxococcota bacterium]
MNDKNTPCCYGLSEWLSPDLFKALSDPNRVTMLARIAEEKREQTVTEIAGCCPVDMSVVSRHLRILRDAGILSAQKRGKEVYYSVRVDDFVRLLRNLADALEACCPSNPSGQ